MNTCESALLGISKYIRGMRQDEHPSLPDSISLDLADFLLACFQKDPQRRPDARALLGHAWLGSQRATLRASWSRTAAARARPRTDAHASVSSVVERILRVPHPSLTQSIVVEQLRASISFANGSFTALCLKHPHPLSCAIANLWLLCPFAGPFRLLTQLHIQPFGLWLVGIVGLWLVGNAAAVS